MLKLQHIKHGTTCFVKGKCECVGRENVEFFLETKRKMCLGEMDGILCELLNGVLIPAWLSKVGRYPSCHS